MPDTPIIARAELGGDLSVGLRVLIAAHTDPTAEGRRKANRGGPSDVLGVLMLHSLVSSGEGCPNATPMAESGHRSPRSFGRLAWSSRSSACRRVWN
jgi:hypothetical protein